MQEDLQQALIRCETDIDGALQRFSGDEALYESCLAAFLNDPTMSDLDRALETQSWDDAFTAAHALKGLAGNMGFVPLFHSAAELVVLIRAGRTKDAAVSYQELKRCYRLITSAIRRSCTAGSAE